MKRVLLIVLVGAVMAGVPASAHHSFAASYFEDKSLTVEGELVQFQLRNPHAWVYVMAPDETGTMQKYSIEWSAGTRLKEGGMTEETLKAGDHVIVTGAPGRLAEDHKIHLKSISRPSDGWKWGGGGGGGGGRGRGGRGAPPQRGRQGGR